MGRDIEMQREVNINYSEKLIKDVEELCFDLANASDSELVAEKMNFYLNPKAHIYRIRETVLANDKIIQCVSTKGNEVPYILEIGSGMGTCCMVMKAFTGAKCVGVEPAPESYHNLLNCINDFKECNPNLSYESISCGGENIPKPDETFDFIYSFEVMEHVEDPKKVFEEIYRLLKPNGCAYIATCNYDSFYEGHYKRFWNPFIGVEGNKKRYRKKGLSEQFLNELNFITKKKIREWVGEIGYKELIFNPQMESKHMFPEIMLNYPKEFIMPQGVKCEPVWLHKKIESPKVASFLGKYDREYKLYFLLVK